MEEYINLLLQQVRCRNMHASIASELRQHMEDQAQDNRELGMDEAEAMQAAVKDMGDPVEAGISLDRIHRPMISWSMILVMAVISLCSLLVHTVIFITFGSSTDSIDAMYLKRSIIHVALGFAAMLIFYRLDYTFFVKYARPVAVMFYLFLYLGVFCMGTTVHGATAFWTVGPLRFSLIHLSFLNVPLYGALLCRYRGTGARGIAKAFLWMLPPVWICAHIPCLSQAALLFFMMALLLSFAVYKKWFLVPAKKFLPLFWGAALLMPAAWVTAGICLRLFADYQIMRILSFLNRGTSPYNYTTNLLSSYLQQAKLFGSSGMEIAGYLPEYNTAYIFTFMSSCYGLAVSVLVCFLVLFAACRMMHISLRQQNHAGMMIGWGCGLVLLLSTVVNILENCCLLPQTQTFLPFFSYGATGQIVSYILAGIVLSVYRYQNIIPQIHRPQSV